MDDKPDKNVDSTNDERIVDGDLYLIKTISRYPILWDRKNFDSDQRNEIWLMLSKKFGIKRNCLHNLKSNSVQMFVFFSSFQLSG